MSARQLSALVVISSLVLIAPAVVPNVAHAVVTFTNISAGLTAVNYSSAVWGDYDGDGDLDVLLSGYSGIAPVTRLYRNSGGTFADAGAGLPGVRNSMVAWGDYDGDGDLDILLSGDTDSGYISGLYRNDAGVFNDIGAGLPGVADGSSAFGDYDNDGDLDILLTGDTGAGYISRVYRNDAGVFSDINAGLPGVMFSATAWGDYDGDGDLDFVLTGATGSGRTTRLYRNDGGVFADIGAGLVAVKYSAVAWGDYDSDGDLDLLLEGDSSTGFTARVYRNDSASFSDIGAGLPAVRYGAVVWGDYDNDGALDFVLTGEATGPTYVASVYHNDGGVFSDIGAGLPGVGAGSAAWGNYDNDGDLDLLLTGWGTGGRISRIFRSDGAPANTPPSAPSELTALIAGNRMTLSWTPSSDAQTPASGLSYNLRIGTTPAGSEIMPAMSNAATGYRRVVQLGNAQKQTTWTVTVPSPTETYYWSVQAVDGAWAGSAFAAEESFHGVTFTDIGAGMPGVRWGSVAWGDYDGDGDLDVLLTGYTDTGSVSGIYRNDDGTFTDIGAGLAGVEESSVAWGDYDNDGDLDILLTGYNGQSGSISRVYRNDAGVFTDIAAGLPGVDYSSVAWADYDNDGDLDILLTGMMSTMDFVSEIYRNDNGTFIDIDTGLPEVASGSVAWGDYDNDGDLDILLTGYNGQSGYISRVYRNDAGVFTDIAAGLPGADYSSVAWGDYNNDGDLDILLTGANEYELFADIYRNDGGAFTSIDLAMPGVCSGSVAWGDYDNDGDLDILFTGMRGFGEPEQSDIYRNDGGVFTSIGAELPDVGISAVGWGDYDNDGDLDLLLTGLGSTGMVSRIFRSDGAAPNTPPETPDGLSTSIAGDRMTLSWTASADAQTPASGLSYNLRIGTTQGGGEIMPAMSDAATGYRRVVRLGNAQERTTWTVTTPPASGICYWTVQAVDGAWSGSAFATEQRCDLVRFTDSDAGLPGVTQASVAWGDYDNDADLDILLTGVLSGGSPFISRVYRNDGGAFTDIAAGLPGVIASSVAWGDYDNDGDLDLVLTGDTGSGYIARVYRNDGSSFTDIVAGLPSFVSGSSAFGDYDNDGDLDILLTGIRGPDSSSRVYRNDAGVFTDIAAGLPGVYASSAAWGDYDNDGDLDILLAGDSDIGYIARVYRNDRGTFVDITAGLPGVRDAAVDWGDFDGDGDLDLLLGGLSTSGTISRVYRNDAGSFSDIEAALPGAAWGSFVFGDYDNDGDLDILLTGSVDNLVTPISRVYRNDDGAFSDIGAGLTEVMYSAGAWGDYDNDGDLDILVAGGSPFTLVSRVYRNDHARPNTPPTAPGGLSASLVGSELTLSWDPSTDTATPSEGLSYNIRVGTTPGGWDRMAPMADAITGYRRVMQLGNGQQRTSWRLTSPPDGPNVYWSVQAIDGAFAGSAFATESRLLGIMEPPQVEAIADIPGDQGHQVRISWIRSSHDSQGSAPAIVEYALFRRIGEGAAARSLSETEKTLAYADVLYPPGSWDFIATVPADAEYQYSMVVPTLVDSSIVEGMQYSVFFVRARTATPGTYFDSPPDSGYSVDNLAPGVPGGLHFSSATILAWNEALEEDFDYFAIYGSSNPALDPTAELIGQTTETTQDISEHLFLFYHVTAIDFSGNEGEAASIENETSEIEEAALLPSRFALRAIVPNPAASGATVAFDLPKDSHITIRIFDVSGRIIATLIDGQVLAGRHTAAWKGAPAEGGRIAAGLYFCRMQAGEFTETRRVVIAH